MSIICNLVKYVFFQNRRNMYTYSLYFKYIGEIDYIHIRTKDEGPRFPLAHVHSYSYQM